MSKTEFNFYLGVDEQDVELYAQLDVNNYRIVDTDSILRAVCHTAVSDSRLSGISKEQLLEETEDLASCIKYMKFVSLDKTQVEHPFINIKASYIEEFLKRAIEVQHALQKMNVRVFMA